MTEPAHGLTRITVNLTPKAAEALERTAEREQLSKTDTVNRALQGWDFLTKLIETNGGSLLVVGPDGTAERIHIV